MIIVRIFKIAKDGEKRYISNAIHKAKNKKFVQVSFVKRRERAYIFKTAEEISQLQFLLSNGNHGVRTEELHLEKEEIADTFESVFGHDKDKQERDLLMSRKMYEDRLSTFEGYLEVAQTAVIDTENSEAVKAKQNAIDNITKEIEITREAIRDIDEELEKEPTLQELPRGNTYD